MNVKIRTPIEIALSAEDGFTTAKKLYEWLGLDTTQYSKWVQSYLIDNPFAEEGIDYSSLMRSKEFTSDYRISASFAKKLAATAKSENRLMPPVMPVLSECEDTKDCRDCLFSGRPPYKSPCSECRNKSMWEMRQSEPRVEPRRATVHITVIFRPDGDLDKSLTEIEKIINRHPDMDFKIAVQW